ncbi:MAG: nucleotidyltransferase family protein [Desulfitobacteriaceae bacterium]
MEAIILVGGLGTRLRNVLSDLPKPMAPVEGRPFLVYLLQYLKREGISKVILSTGFMHEKIEVYFRNSYTGIEIAYSREVKPLGTGGAIKKALEQVNGEMVVVLNGDSFFDVNIKGLVQKHLTHKSDITLSLKPLCNYDRYGTVIRVGDHVTKFLEKEWRAQGTINGGLYLIRSDIFERFQVADSFSFEEFLGQHVNNLCFVGYISDTYFIDIGIPDDYQRAQNELALHF